MKSENIPADIKSKSIKDAKDEINKILSKLENNETNLEDSIKDYERLIKLNNYIDTLFKKRVKEISSINIDSKRAINDKK
jgi:exonuclease VII small subunit